MRRTSSGVSVAATTSGRFSTTQSYASSMSNTGGGGSAERRPASRATNHAPIAQARPMTISAVTSTTDSAGIRTRDERPLDARFLDRGLAELDDVVAA